jgi:hypothetical protein
MNYKPLSHTNRIAEYLVVVGAGDTLTPLQTDEQPIGSAANPLRMVYDCHITDRYPLEDRDISLPSGLTLFCLPHGLQLYVGPRTPKFYSFIQTSDKGVHLVGCCLVFFEPLTDTQLSSLKDLITLYNIPQDTIEGKKIYAPKCLCLISQWPFIESFKKYLRYLYSISLNPSSIPIERYICNFLDDVPAPPPGRVEVLYCIGHENVSFQCPPANEPNVWSGLPMKHLFECFPHTLIISLLSCVICERQIVFVSSQYSLLTACAEVLLSLIYPLTWTHVYIPILPRRLIGKSLNKYIHDNIYISHSYLLLYTGVLSAPVPFIVGIHITYFSNEICWDATEQRGGGGAVKRSLLSLNKELEAALLPETVKVYIDDGVIDFGSLGEPPPLPESRKKKILTELRY